MQNKRMGEQKEAWLKKKTQGFKKVRIREKMKKGYLNPIITVSFIAFLLLDHNERRVKMLYS